MLDSVTVETFVELVGERFTVESGDGSSQLFELVEATSNPDHARTTGSTRDPFSLIFRGPIQPFLLQGTYRFQHREIGELDIFIVPIGPRDDHMQYQAVFS